MRKIERQMNAAIAVKRNWSSGNTRVRYVTLLPGDGRVEESSCVFLHGNLIASVWHSSGGDVIVERDMFRRWPTATTRSRLVALGVNASIKQGLACIDGQPV